MPLEIQSSDIDPNDMPIPAGFRILIEPIKIEEKTSGGIVLADSAVKAKEYLRYIGRVVAMGPLCYKHERFDGPWCSEGDFVAFRQHAGQDLKVRTAGGDTSLKLVNDDDILARIPNPEAILIYA